MCILQSIVAALVAKDSLSDSSPCNLVEMGSGCVAKQARMEAFVYAKLIYYGSKDLLEYSRRDAFFSDGKKEWACSWMVISDIDLKKSIEYFRENQLALSPPFFCDPCKAGFGIDILYIKAYNCCCS